MFGYERSDRTDGHDDDDDDDEPPFIYPYDRRTLLTEPTVAILMLVRLTYQGTW